MAVKNPFRTTLIAPCGMNCAICMAYLKEKNHCNGCRAPDRKCHINCAISACEKVQSRFCSPGCTEYPCRRLRHLDERYRKKYGMSMMENLEAIRRDGIRAFVRPSGNAGPARPAGGRSMCTMGNVRCAGKGGLVQRAGATGFRFGFLTRL